MRNVTIVVLTLLGVLAACGPFAPPNTSPTSAAPTTQAANIPTAAITSPSQPTVTAIPVAQPTNTTAAVVQPTNTQAPPPAPTNTAPPPTKTPTPLPATATNTSIPPSATPTRTPTKTSTPTPSVSQVLKQISINGGASDQAIATCPSDTKVTGGGFATSGSMSVYSDAMDGNGWEVAAKNNAGTSGLLNAYAICVTDLAGSVQLVFKQVTVGAGSTGQAVQACPAGTVLTGGGFAANTGEEVYSNAPSGNGWESAAKNTTGAGLLLNAYALCYNGAGATSTQPFTQVTVGAGTNGNTSVACPSGRIVTGGGYAANSGEIVFNTSKDGNGWHTFATNTTAIAHLLNSYAVCTKF